MKKKLCMSFDHIIVGVSIKLLHCFSRYYSSTAVAAEEYRKEEQGKRTEEFG